MHQPLTDSSRKVLDQAQIEARSLNQEFVGTEHVLLALLHVPGTQALRTLRQQHVDKDGLRSQLLSVMPFSESAPVVTGALPMSPKVQHMINAGLVMSRSLREQKLSTRVLLLALMDEQSAPFLRALRDTGVDMEQLRQALAEKPTETEV